MIVPTQSLLTVAMQAPEPYGVLALNVIGLEHAEAIIAAAETESSPVILQVSQNAIRYRGAVAPLAAACREMAKAATVPVALHFDHATTRESFDQAASNGFSSVMFDAAAATEEANIQHTAMIVEVAHAQGLTVEGEIGIVGGKDGVVTTDSGLTDPATASRFVSATGIDALAVAIGTEHGMTERRALLDFPRLDQIRAAVDIPLVLHGSSGVPDHHIAEAIRRGITKVNIATQLNIAMTSAIREHLRGNPEVTDPRVYGKEARRAMIELVRAKCQVVGSSGRAIP